MKRLWILAGLALLLAACGSVQLDTSPEGNPNRTVSGTVELGDSAPLPPGAEMSVRVLDTVRAQYQAPTAVLGEPSANTPPVELPPKVLGEQIIKDAQGTSIPFEVHYQATADQLRIGLVLDARISIAHRIRFYNVNSYSLDSDNADEPHHIYVNAVGR